VNLLLQILTYSVGIKVKWLGHNANLSLASSIKVKKDCRNKSTKCQGSKRSVLPVICPFTLSFSMTNRTIFINLSSTKRIHAEDKLSVIPGSNSIRRLWLLRERQGLELQEQG